VGIDGYPSATVEQDGTDSDCQSGSPDYYAWYEMYGDSAVSNGNSVPLATSLYPVSAGDTISATVTFAAGAWDLAISDLSVHDAWTFSIPIAEPATAPSQNSAEWVIERPQVCSGSSCALATLSNFGSISFTGAAATKSGQTSSLSALPAFPLQMSNGSSLLALSGPVTGGGTGFSATYYASS
jgi:hypothetical protein